MVRTSKRRWDIESAQISAIVKLVTESADSARLAWEVVHDAINARREAVIEALIPILSPDDRVFALALAAEEGVLDVVRRLIPLTEPRSKNSMALVCAARGGHKDIVELLLPVSDALADHSAALFEASRSGHAEVVKILIPHSDPRDGESRALRQAVQEGNLRVVKLLLPVSSSILTATRIFPAAAAQGALGVVKLMLKAKLPDAAYTYQSGLDLAAVEGHVDVVSVLLEAIQKLDRPRRFGESAIFSAACRGHREIVTLLAPHVHQSACNIAVVAAIERGHRATATALMGYASFEAAADRLFSADHQSMLQDVRAEHAALSNRADLDEATQSPRRPTPTPSRL